VNNNEETGSADAGGTDGNVLGAGQPLIFLQSGWRGSPLKVEWGTKEKRTLYFTTKSGGSLIEILG